MTAAAGWYHCSVKTVSRSTGRSAVAAAAYRLGDKLHEEALDLTHDYTRRSGVVTTFALAPEGSPDWALQPQSLWNAAEAAENRRNSQVAREYELALPSTVSGEQREAIARGFAQHLVDRYGVAVTAAIHEPSRHGDDRNFHAHILTTTRSMGEEGLGKKTRVLDDRKTGPQEILHLRGYAADLINDALERAGVDERVDHRSFEARGIDREATEHLGPTANEIERRGGESERGSRNRDIGEGNRKLDELVTDLAGVEAEIVAEEERRLNDRFGSPPNPAEGGPGLWEGLKQAARSVFGLAQPSAAPDSPDPLAEDEKRAARDSFIDVAEQDRQPSGRYGAAQEPAPDLSAAPASPGLWESVKLTARRVFGLGETHAGPESPEPLTVDEKGVARHSFMDVAEEQRQAPQSPEPLSDDSKRAARDPFADTGTTRVQLSAGEIPQGGLGMNWRQRTAVFMTELRDHAVEAVRNTWERYVERSREAIDKDIGPGHDDGPDLTR